MNRTKLGLMVVAFVVIVGVMEILAVKLGSLDFLVPSGAEHPAIADNPGD
ncbi:hypothetical protein [Actinomadura chibensis]|nr:hypothetical protein [Actinomadura chibensis]